MMSNAVGKIPVSHVKIPGNRAPNIPANLRRSSAKDGQFNDMLNREIDDLKFSKHAMTRLKSRNGNLSDGDLMRINKAVETADKKGSRESLLLMDNLGLIVNIRNRTVLTAIDTRKMKEHIFTNIDSTVIVAKE